MDPLNGDSPKDEEALRALQIQLLAGGRAFLMLSRICIGPMVVSMSAEYSYSAEQKGLILSAYAGGYALTQVAGGLAADRIGGAPVLALGLLVSSCCLLGLPSAAEMGIPAVCWLLWLMGFMSGPTYPAIQALIAKWSTLSLRSYASALNGAGASAGSLLALGLTPVLSARQGWRLTSRCFGLVLFTFASLWVARGRSCPPRPHVSSDEEESPPDKQVNGKEASADRWLGVLYGYLHLMLAPQVLVIIVAHCVHNFVRYFLFAWMPTYYDEVLGVSSDTRGVLMILPELCSTLLGVIVARVARRLQQSGALTTLGVRRWFAGVSFVGQGLALVALSRVGSSGAVTVCLCTIQSFSTLQGPGFHANYLDVTKDSSGLVTGVGDSFATFASGLGPLLASYVLSQDGLQGRAGWRILFLAFAFTNLIGIGLYVPFASSTPVDVHGKRTAS